jgi:hypothetical protein
LVTWINDFHDSLEKEYEAGLTLANFGKTITFHVNNIGYLNPSLISFEGFKEDGDPVKLIQHVTQINILLTKIKRKDPQKPKTPIGFAT